MSFLRSMPHIAAVLIVMALASSVAHADAFAEYTLTGEFTLPAASPVDVLPDGRLVTLAGADVLTETAPGSRSFAALGALPDADLPDPQWASAAFVRVSPDGSRIAVGNNGGASFANYEVGVFDLADLSGDWFAADHYDAAWIDETYLGVSATSTQGPPGLVNALDTTSVPGSPEIQSLVAGIPGYSGGLAFDADGRLFAGVGFATNDPSETGWIRAFDTADWQAALAGGPALDFTSDGTLVGDVLSAAALGFDSEGNLHVGGGDLFAGSDGDYAGLVHHLALADALAGGGPIDPTDPAELRQFDPDAGPDSFYDLRFNPVTEELYVRQGAQVWTYIVPEPAGATLLLLAVATFTRRCSGRRV